MPELFDELGGVEYVDIAPDATGILLDLALWKAVWDSLCAGEGMKYVMYVCKGCLDPGRCDLVLDW